MIAANAVRAVDYGVADAEFGQVLDERFNVADLLLPLGAPTRGDASGEQLGFSDEINAFFKPAETGVQRGNGNAYFFVAGLKVFE